MENIRIKSQVECQNTILTEYIYKLDGVEYSICKCELTGKPASYIWNGYEVATLAAAIEIIELNSLVV